MSQQQMTLDEFATRGMKAQAEVDKLCHAGDPETSRQAAQKMIDTCALNRQQRCVLGCINSSNFEDFTALELAGGVKDEWYYVIQRRMHELPQIKCTGEKREGHAVWKLT